MLNLYPYLCDDPDMDLSPIRAKSERLYRDILRERQFYAEHPECDNVHFFHMALQSSVRSCWVDRWGIAVLSICKNRYMALRSMYNQAGKKKFSKAYILLGVRQNGITGMLVHQLVADVFLPNTDFTKCQLDHLNCEHFDNNALNLDRVTPEENVRRREVFMRNKKGQPIPEKYQSLKNYLTYLQSKKSK